MNRKLQLMRRKHAQTREYMEMNALRGIVKDGAGITLYDYFTEFGLAQISVDFLLGTAGTNIQGKVREVLRAMEDNLLGESMTDVHALVSREFFDKLIAHSKTEEAYKFYAATGAQPLRQDVRRNFPFAGIVFEEYADTVTLSTKATERLIPAGEGTPSRSAPSTPSPPMAAQPTFWKLPIPSACRSRPASISMRKAAGSI